MHDAVFLREQGETRKVEHEHGLDRAEFLPQPRFDGQAHGGIFFQCVIKEHILEAFVHNRSFHDSDKCRRRNAHAPDRQQEPEGDRAISKRDNHRRFIRDPEAGQR